MQAQELTGVVVPKFYNPAAVNPLKYAEQVNKRKLLWSHKKEVCARSEMAVLPNDTFFRKYYTLRNLKEKKSVLFFVKFPPKYFFLRIS